MVSVLEGNSFSSQLGRGLGEALGAFGGGALHGKFQQKLMNKQEARSRQQAQQFSDAIKREFGVDLSGLPIEAQQQFALQLQKERAAMGLEQERQKGKFGLEQEKQRGKRGLYESLFGRGGMQGEEESQGFQSLSPEQETMLALENPVAFNAYSNLKQHHQKEEEKVQSKQGLQETLGEMTNTLLEGNLGYTPKRYTAKGRRDVQYFNTLGTQLESIGKDMVSKGVLSAPRFSYLLSNLPSAGKTDAANAGALEAWQKELGLEIPGIEELKKLYGEKPQKSKKSSKIKFDVKNPEHKAKRDQLMKKFKGDREKVKDALDREFEE